jgi:aminodeoxyfutalosine deaminase
MMSAKSDGVASVFRARWIFPVASPPIADSAIEIGGDGRILAIHPRPPQNAVDLGNAAIVPGFINAHLHLEFSDLAEPLSPPRPFPSWIRRLVEYRRSRGDGTAAVIRGWEECRRSGTAAIGEIATRDWRGDDLPANGPIAVVFRELLGVQPPTLAPQFEIASRFLQNAERDPRKFIRGLSPHAPFSVHPRLLEQLIDLATRSRAPLAVHLAETKAELELLREGTGELVQMMSDFGQPVEGLWPRGTRPLDLLRKLADVERVIIAHGNYLDDEELDFIAARPNFAVVYCPRTHDFFGHTEHPWRKLTARGGLVALGTDGRCSNPDLSIWNELLFLHGHFPDVDPALLLRMGTFHGARALGLESDLGTLEIGKLGRAAVIRLGDHSQTDAFAARFHPHSRVAGLLSDSSETAAD